VGIKRFENNTISYEQIQKLEAQESIKTISRNDVTIEKVTKEIKVYTEQEHLDKGNEEINELYKKFKAAILNLGDIETKPKKLYIAFVSDSNIIDIHIQKKAFKIWINMQKGELDDPKNLMRDVSSTGHWGNGDYELQINSDENLEYILSLVKQSLRKNKK
jgi:predicted transport protein